MTGESDNAYVQFAQSSSYWGRTLTASQLKAQPLLDPGHAANVIVQVKADDLSRFTDLSTGAAQIAEIEASDWSSVTGNSQYQYLTQPPWNGEVALIGLNPNIYPTNITAVRQAIVHAINYTQLSDTAYQGELKPYVGPEYPAWSQFYDLGNYSAYQYNIASGEADTGQRQHQHGQLPCLRPRRPVRLPGLLERSPGGEDRPGRR